MIKTIQLSLITMTLISLSPLSLASSLEPLAPPSEMSSAMYSINDICERLKSGAEPELTPFSGPTSGPSDSVRCTLNDVMAVAPKKDAASSAQASEVLSGKSYWSLREDSWGKQIGTMVNQGAQIYTPGTTDQAIATGYHNGLGVVKGDADLVAANLKAGIDIFGVLGSYNPKVATGDVQASEVLEGKTFSNAQGTDWVGTMPNQDAQTYIPGTQDQVIAAGYHNGQDIIKGDEELKASNLLKGVELFGVEGSYECQPAVGCPSVATGTAVASEVLAGKTFSNSQGLALVGTLPNQGAKNYTPSTTDQPIAAGYYNGSGVVKGDTNLVSNNIKNGVTLFGIVGDANLVDTSSGNATANDIASGKKAWVKGSEITGNVLVGTNVSGNDGQKTFTIPDGFYSGGKTATVNDSHLTEGNIKSGVTLFGIAGDANVVDTSSGNATANDIASDKKAWVKGSEITGNVPVGINVSGNDGQKTFTIPDGFYSGGKTATVNDNNLTEGNIKNGVTILGVTGNFTGGPICSGTLNGTRWCDNGDGTVMDMTTGLIWLQKADWGGQKKWDGNMNDNAHVRAGILKAGMVNANLSDNSVEGDWRLPTRTELEGITSGTEPVSSSDMRAFSGVQSNWYWTSTSAIADSNYAWFVNLSNGAVQTYFKPNFLYVWPVRCRK